MPEPTEGVPVDEVPAEQRTRTVAVRLTDAEYAAWSAAMRADGRGQMGRWVRETVAGHLADRRPARQVEGASELRAALTRIGTNLNQVTRALNAAVLGGPGVEVRDVLAVVDTARKVMAEVRDALREQG